MIAHNSVVRNMIFSPRSGIASRILKVGTFDDPSVFEPQVAIFTIDRQPFHHIPDGVQSFERLPG
jgi:hypothetical protein